MLTTIKGIYDHGKITLIEEPPITATRAEVIITFLHEQQNAFAKPKRILGGLEGKIIVPDDFNEPLDDLKDYM
jgi:hypothetical protein